MGSEGGGVCVHSHDVALHSITAKRQTAPLALVVILEQVCCEMVGSGFTGSVQFISCSRRQIGLQLPGSHKVNCGIKHRMTQSHIINTYCIDSDIKNSIIYIKKI